MKVTNTTNATARKHDFAWFPNPLTDILRTEKKEVMTIYNSVILYEKN